MALKPLLDEFISVTSDWNATFIWLGKVKAVISKNPLCISEEKYRLAKRLSQCLSPETVHQVHLASLEIYELIFASPNFIEDFGLFSGGFLPFFEYANKECKLSILKIIIDKFLIISDQLTFAFPGIVCSLLPGCSRANSDQEINDKVIEVFDGIANRDQQGLFGAVWQGLLRSPKIRLQALYYLSLRLKDSHRDLDKFLPQRNLLINSLKASMNGPQFEVQQATLELLINHFPISVHVLSDEEKITLIEHGFKLLKSTHKQLVWAWLFPGDIIDYFTGIKQKALKNLFEVVPKRIDESILPLEIVKKVLEKISPNYEFLQPIIVDMLSYANTNIDSQSSMNINSNIKSVLIEWPDFELEIWDALQQSLEHELRDDKVTTISVIKFFLSNFSSKESEKSLVPLLELLLSGIRQLSKSLGQALELIQMILNRMPSNVPGLSASVKNYHQYFSAISSDPSKAEYLKISASLLLPLEKTLLQPESKEGDDDYYEEDLGGSDSEWIKCLSDAMQNPSVEVALTGVENIIGLLESENAYYEKLLERDCDSSIVLDVFERLWIIIDEATNRKKAVELILRIERYDHRIFMNLLKAKLLGESPRRISDQRLNQRDSIESAQEFKSKEIKRALRTFTELWKCTSKFFPSQLVEMFREGDGVFFMLDYLENASPETRQLSREWVVEALDKFECVLDPVLSILLKIKVIKDVDVYKVLEGYDAGMALDAFKKLKKLIRNGGEMVISKASNLKPRTEIMDFLDKNLCEKADNYIEVMLEIALLYIRTETDDKDFVKSNHTVQAAAAEFLDLTLSQGSLKLAHKAVNRVLISLHISITQDDGVLQLLLLNILRVIFFECKISQGDEKFKDVISSDLFSKVYLGVLRNQDTYILSHWINFIVESLAMVTFFLDPAGKKMYYARLIHSFCEEIPKASEKASLFEGLKVVLHKALDIGGTAMVKTAITYSQDTKSKGWLFGMFAKGESQNSNENELKIEVLGELETVIGTCLNSINECTLAVEVSSKGVGMMSGGSSVKISHPALNILNPILDKYPNEFMLAVIRLWRKNMGDAVYKKLIAIIISMSFNVKSLVQAFNFYIDKEKLIVKKQNIDKISIISICHIFCAIFSCLLDESVTSIVEEKRLFWTEVYTLLSKLESTAIKSCHLWLMDILFLLLNRVSIDDEIRDSSFKRLMQNFAESIIRSVNSTSFQNTNDDYYPPKTPSIYLDESPQLLERRAGLIVLKNNLYKIIFTLYQADSRDRGISLIQLPITEVLNAFKSKSRSQDNELMSDLLMSLVCTPDTKMVFKKSLVDFIWLPEFFECFDKNNNCFKNWCLIVNAIANTSSSDKTALINDILSREIRWPNDTEKLQLKGRKLKNIAFLIYSSEKDAYKESMDVISKVLIDFLKTDKNLSPWVLFVVRVLLVKLSHSALSSTWPQLWPHVLTELMQMLQLDSCIEYKYAALKFLDLISAINSEEFLMYQWLFFYDSLNAAFNHIDEFPLVNKLVPEGLSETEIKANTECVPRELIIRDYPNSVEELQKKAAELCNEIVRTNSLRTEPDEKSIALVIEKDFFELDIKNLRPNN